MLGLIYGRDRNVHEGEGASMYLRGYGKVRPCHFGGRGRCDPVTEGVGECASLIDRISPVNEGVGEGEPCN